MEKLDFLINYLLKENKNMVFDNIPVNETDKKNLWRSLCNIRAPKPISNEYLEAEKEYLQEELSKKQITKVEDINIKLKQDNKMYLWQGDITTLKIDAIVNPANSQGLGCFRPLHKCLDNQIQTFAGVALRLECNEIMKEKDYYLKTGEAFITKGYNLPAKYVIHTVGPIIQYGVTDEQKEQLANCYINSLNLAIKNKIRTIAFPCISTGEFRFPKDEACKIAIKTVKEFLIEHSNDFDKIVFSVYSKGDYDIYEQISRES